MIPNQLISKKHFVGSPSKIKNKLWFTCVYLLVTFTVHWTFGLLSKIQNRIRDIRKSMNAEAHVEILLTENNAFCRLEQLVLL
jgi:hypothetical protein